MPGRRLWLVDTRAPSLWSVEPTTAHWMRGDSLWLVDTLTDGGATVDSHRVAAWRNGIRDRDSRWYGRVFFALQSAFSNFPHKPTCYRTCVIDWNAEKWRHTSFIPSAVPRIACREVGSHWLNLELAPLSNVPWLHLGEMAFESQPRDGMDVFFLRSTLRRVFTHAQDDDTSRYIFSKFIYYYFILFEHGHFALHAQYHRTNRFLFCPGRLSQWRFASVSQRPKFSKK